MKTKRKSTRVDLATIFAIVSFLTTIITSVWIGGFKMSALMNDVQDLKEDMNDVKTEIKEIKTDLRKIDVRVTAIEQKLNMR